MARALILGSAPLPFEPAEANTGPGIRSWQLTRPLLAAGHEVRLLALAEEGDTPSPSADRSFHPRLEYLKVDVELARDAGALAERVAAFAPDFLVGATAYPSFLLCRAGLDEPLWADLFGDPMAEAQARAALLGDDWAVENGRYMLRPILRRADAFSVVSERQRDALIGQLGLLGRLNRWTAGHELVHVVPCAWAGDEGEVSTPELPGRRQAKEDGEVVALWSGGFNTWCDVDTFLDALEQALERHRGLRVVVTGGAIPGFDERTYERFRQRVEASPHRRRIELTGWIPRRELARREAEADFAVVAEKALYERHLGSANRCLQWMGAGLPVVCTRLSELSGLIEREGLGLVCAPGDAGALAGALGRLAADSELRAHLGARASAYVRAHLTSEATAAPLVAWAAAPVAAPDRGRPPVPDPAAEAAAAERRDRQAELAGLRAHATALEGELAAIHGSRMWSLWMASLAVRRWPRGLLRWLASRPAAIGRGLAAAARRFGEWARPALGKIAGWAVWLRLALFTIARLARAGLRGLLPARQPPGVEAAGGETASEARRPRLLVVCPYPLIPAYQGGSRRIVRLLEELSKRCEIHLFTYAHTSDDPAQRRALEPYCRRIHVHRREDAGPARPWDLEPRSVQYLASRKVRERLADLVHREGIDLVQLEFTELGQYADAFGDAKVVLSELDLGFVTSFRRRRAGFHRRFEIDRELWSDLGGWMRLFRYELRTCERVDQVHVMSARDGALLARFLSDGWRRIRVVPNGVEIEEEAPPPAAERGAEVLFLGYFGHSPNLDAVHYLVEEIWPRVRARHGDARLTVVGANPPASVAELDGRDGVRVVGTVPDPRPYYRRHRLLAAPLRAGSGTRLKILEAFAQGLPVVTTPLGAEGLDARGGEHLLLAESAAEHAEAICRLLEDDAFHARLATAGRELVAARYGWPQVAARAFDAYRELLADEGSARRGGLRLDEEPRPSAGPLAPPAEVEVSIVIPTLDGGARLEQALGAIANQRFERPFEVICVDSGSGPEERATFERFGVRLAHVPKAEFNHGLTRDLGAGLARGRVLVFLNQDAVPCDREWLHTLVDPLLRPGPYAAIQGGIREFPGEGERFFWHSGGARFYFTRETERWLERYRGLGFSTVNCAIRREVWERHPFGWAPIMEDKKWQRRVVAAGLEIAQEPRAGVFHSHVYGGRALLRRCAAEGYGWHTLGVSYSLGDLLGDLAVGAVYREALRGLLRGEIRSAAELLFPWLRPLALYWGNHRLRALP